MNIQVIYPPQLQLLSDPSGNDYVVGFSPSLNKMVRISISSLLSGRSVPVWEPDGSYDTDFIVEWSLKFWKSLEDDNEGNIPTEDTHWTEVSEDETVITNTPDSLVKTLLKTAHAFTVGNVLTIDGTGAFVKVNDTTTQKVIGVVKSVPDVNTFELVLAGFIEGLSGLTPGSKYYATNTGTLSTSFSDLLVLVATSATAGYMLSSGGGGGGGSSPAIAAVYANIAAMLADQSNQEENAYYWVTTATTDPTVTSGWAIYRKLASSTATLATDYVKVQEQESLDIVATPDASETVKGKAELLDQTEAEAVASAGTSAGADHTRVVSGRGLWWFWAKVKILTHTISGVWTFSASPVVPDLTANDNSTKAANTKYVDEVRNKINIGGMGMSM